MRKTTVYLSHELHRALKESAKREGRSEAEIIRQALSEYFTRKPKPKLRSIGAGADGELGAAAAKAWGREQWAERSVSPQREAERR